MAVFDTAFHQTMPPAAYMYALPHEYYEKYHVRKYGFHGTSVKYLVSQVRNAQQALHGTQSYASMQPLSQVSPCQSVCSILEARCICVCPKPSEQ